jgi:hypothetical protein
LWAPRCSERKDDPRNRVLHDHCRDGNVCKGLEAITAKILDLPLLLNLIGKMFNHGSHAACDMIAHWQNQSKHQSFIGTIQRALCCTWALKNAHELCNFSCKTRDLGNPCPIPRQKHRHFWGIYPWLAREILPLQTPPKCTILGVKFYGFLRHFYACLRHYPQDLPQCTIFGDIFRSVKIPLMTYFFANQWFWAGLDFAINLR